jgi:hypothetical protein
VIKGRAMKKRRRFKQTDTLEERLTDAAYRFREKAKRLPAEATRDDLLTKARQAEASAHLSEWLRLPVQPSPEKADA